MSDTLAALLPGDVVAQGKAIFARLALAFPASKFQHRFLPPRIDKAAWRDLTTAGQPFLGLGFEKITRARDESRTFLGIAQWILLVAVRAVGKPNERYFGDAQGVGVLTLAPLAAGMLHGWMSPTGYALVTDIANVASDEWADDSSIIKIGLQIPLTLSLQRLIQDPGGAGIFAEMAETWVLGGRTGVSTTYTSNWENPHVAQEP